MPGELVEKRRCMVADDRARQRQRFEDALEEIKAALTDDMSVELRRWLSLELTGILSALEDEDDPPEDLSSSN